MTSTSKGGRPKKVRPPPPAPRGSVHTLPEFVRVDDLHTLAGLAQLPMVDGVDAGLCVARINDALRQYVGWRNNARRGAGAAEVRDWCQDLAEQARALMRTLGQDQHTPDGSAFQDALAQLRLAWPNVSGDDARRARETADLDRLNRLGRLACPDHYAQATDEGASEPGREAALRSLGRRLAATLAIVALLGERGAAYHGERVGPGRKRGGDRDRDEAVKHLYADLQRQYEALFGAELGIVNKPERVAGETSTEGSGVRWLRGLWKVVAPRLGDLEPSAGLSDLKRQASDGAGKQDKVANGVRAARPRKRSTPD